MLIHMHIRLNVGMRHAKSGYLVWQLREQLQRPGYVYGTLENVSLAKRGRPHSTRPSAVALAAAGQEVAAYWHMETAPSPRMACRLPGLWLFQVWPQGPLSSRSHHMALGQGCHSRGAHWQELPPARLVRRDGNRPSKRRQALQTLLSKRL